MLRVTRQTVEALVEGSGKIRATRQTVEILSPIAPPPIERTIVDPLVFSQEATTSIMDLLAEDTLSFSDEAINEGFYNRLAIDTLTFSQEAITSLKTLFTEDTLSFSDGAVNETTFNRSTTDSLVFNQEATVQGNSYFIEDILSFSQNAFIPNVIERTALDQITFDQVATGQSNNLFAEDILTFIDVADQGTKARTLEDILSFSQEATYTSKVKRPFIYETLTFTEEVLIGGSFSLYAENTLIDDVPAWDSETGEFYWIHYGLGQELSYQKTANPGDDDWLTLTQQVGLVHVKGSATVLSASDTLVFVDSASIYDSVDVLVFNQIAEVIVSTPIYEIITFTDSVTLNQVRNPTIVDIISFYQATTYELVKYDTYCTYSPFVGGSSDPNAPTPPSKTPPTLIPQGNVQLTCDATVLTLRGPEYSDRDRLYYQRIKRETRGGTLIVYADPLWPKTQILALDFIGLTETESQEILDFIILSLGKVIQIRDWENQEYDGIIMNPNNPIVRDRRYNNSIALEIELI